MRALSACERRRRSLHSGQLGQLISPSLHDTLLERLPGIHLRDVGALHDLLDAALPHVVGAGAAARAKLARAQRSTHFSRPLKLGFGGSGQIHVHWTLQRAITYLLLMALIDGVPEHDIWCLPRA